MSDEMRFVTELDTLIDEIRKDVNVKQTPPQIRDIEDLIYDRFGISIKLLTTNLLHEVGLADFKTTKGIEFIGNDTATESQRRELITAMKRKDGEVDRVLYKVRGDYSKTVYKVHLNTHRLFQEFDLTTEEVSALLVSSIMRIYYMCEYADTISTSNVIMAEIAEASQAPKPDTKHILQLLHKLDKSFTLDDAEQISSGSTSMVWLKLIKLAYFNKLEQSRYTDHTLDDLVTNSVGDLSYRSAYRTAKERIADARDVKRGSKSTSGASAWWYFKSIINVVYVIYIAVGAIWLLLNGFFLWLVWYLFLYVMLYILLQMVLGLIGAVFGFQDVTSGISKVRDTLISEVRTSDISARDSGFILKLFSTAEQSTQQTKAYGGYIDDAIAYITGRGHTPNTDFALESLMSKLPKRY